MSVLALIERTKTRDDLPPVNGAPCLEWLGLRDRDGYGRVRVKGRMDKMHRYVKAWADGIPLPPRSVVCCHECHHPWCIEVLHLRWDTNKGNAQDSVKAGRMASGDRHGSRLHPECLARGDKNPMRLYPERHPSRLYPWLRQGERAGRAKLTAQQVQQIRIAYRAGGITQKALAERYGVGRTVVQQIIEGRTWRSLPWPA